MNKSKRNIISVILSVIILLTGNISYALTHLDCVIEDNVHFKCSGCCEEGEACERDEQDSIDKITSEKDCCDIHESEQPNHQNIFPAALNTVSNLFHEAQYITDNIVLTEIQEVSYTIHKFNSTNIYLSVSNLRI